MWKSIICSVILPIGLPIGLGIIWLHASPTPSNSRVLSDINHDSLKVRRNALEWLGEFRRPDNLSYIHPLLFHDDIKIARSAIAVVRDTGARESLPFLESAWDSTELDKRRLITAMGRIRFPESLEMLAARRASCSPEDQVLLDRVSEAIVCGVNHVPSTYGPGQPIYNEMGMILFSIGSLYDESFHLTGSVMEMDSLPP